MPSMGELISSARARSIRKAALSEEPRAPESERPQCAMGAQWATAAPIAFTPMAMIAKVCRAVPLRSEEHTSELQSLMRISYAVFCLKKKNNDKPLHQSDKIHNNTC